MSKLKFILLLLMIIPSFFQRNLIAQENGMADFEISIEKMRLPIAPPQDDPSTYHSLDDEVAIMINRVTGQLRLWDIIVGIYIDSSIQNQDSIITDDIVYNFEELEGFTEAIVVIGTNIFQQGVPSIKDENYFYFKSQNNDKNSQKGTAKYSKNIQTQLSVYAEIIDVGTGKSLGSIELDAIHTGGSAKKSKAKAVKLFKEKLKYELKRIYWFSTEVVTTPDGRTELPLGTNSGIYKGLVLELIEPDRIWTIDDEELIVSGGSAGFATVVDTSSDSAGLKILRQWRDRYEGCWAVEHPSPIFALQMNFPPPTVDSYFNIGIDFHGKPLRNYDFGFGLKFIRVTDSYEDNVYGFGFGGFGICRLANNSKIDWGAKLGVDLDIPFKKDDAAQIVHTILFSTHISLISEFLVSKNFDFVFNLGYRFGIKSDVWEYSEDEETYSAYWDKEALEVDNSGFMLSVGIKYLLF